MAIIGPLLAIIDHYWLPGGRAIANILRGVYFLESSDKAARKSQRAVRKSGGLLSSLVTIFLKDGGWCHLSDKMKLAFAEEKKTIHIHVLCHVMPA